MALAPSSVILHSIEFAFVSSPYIYIYIYIYIWMIAFLTESIHSINLHVLSLFCPLLSGACSV